MHRTVREAIDRARQETGVSRPADDETLQATSLGDVDVVCRAGDLVDADDDRVVIDGSAFLVARETVDLQEVR